MSCYVQNCEVISITTGERNVLLAVGKDGSIIEKLKEMLEEYMEKTEPEFYLPVENLLDLIYEHYMEPGGTKDQSGRQSGKGKRKRTGFVAFSWFKTYLTF